MRQEYEFYLELLKAGQDIRFSPHGISMRPFIAQGRSFITVTRLERAPKKNDILLYILDDCLVAHRVHRVLPDGRLIMLGDGNVTPEPPMPLERVLGIVTTVETDGKVSKTSDFGYRLVTTVWNNTLPLRRIAFKIKNRRFVYKNYLPKSCYDTVTMVRSFIKGEPLPADFAPEYRKVLPLVYGNRFETLLGTDIIENPDRYGLNGEQTAQLGEMCFRQQIEQTNLYSELDRIFKYALSDGIRVALMKGLVLGGCYPDATARHSDDADLFAPGENYDKIAAFLRDSGYEEQNGGQPGTMDFWLGDSIHIELHSQIALNTTERGFEAIKDSGLFSPDEFVVEQIDGHTLMTVNPTHHLIYLVYHTAKHFINANCEGRMLTDIALFVNKYYDQIDFDKLHTTMEACGLDKFCDAVFSVCELFFTMNPGARSQVDRNVFSQRNLQKLLEIFLTSAFFADSKQVEKLTIFFRQKAGRDPKKSFSLRLIISMLLQWRVLLHQNRLCRKWNVLK